MAATRCRDVKDRPQMGNSKDGDAVLAFCGLSCAAKSNYWYQSLLCGGIAFARVDGNRILRAIPVHAKIKCLPDVAQHKVVVALDIVGG